MIAQTTITPRFQLHIPVAIRESVGLRKHGKAIIRTEGNKIIIEPIKESPLIKLAGTLKLKKKINLDNIRDQIDYSQT